MSTDTTYAQRHLTPGFSKKELDEEQHRGATKKEKIPGFAWFQFARFLFSTCIFMVILTIFSNTSFMDDVRSNLHSNINYKLLEYTQLIRSNPQATDQLPLGYWIDETRTSDRILCIKSWSGDSMTCSLSYGDNYVGNFRLEPGWLRTPLGVTTLTLVLGMILSALFIIIIPWRYTLFWRILGFK